MSTRRSETKRGLKSTSSPIGWCPMCSTPPASTMSLAQILELPAVRRERGPVELDQQHAAGLELAVAARVQQAPVRIESVARRVDGLGRLVVVARVPILFGQIRQVRDDEVHRLGEGLEEVSLQYVHSILDTVELRIPARE